MTQCEVLHCGLEALRKRVRLEERLSKLLKRIDDEAAAATAAAAAAATDPASSVELFAAALLSHIHALMTATSIPISLFAGDVYALYCTLPSH